MARCMQDPSRTKDIMQEVDSKTGRRWTDNILSRVQEKGWVYISGKPDFGKDDEEVS